MLLPGKNTQSIRPLKTEEPCKSTCTKQWHKTVTQSCLFARHRPGTGDGRVNVACLVCLPKQGDLLTEAMNGSRWFLFCTRWYERNFLYVIAADFCVCERKSLNLYLTSIEQDWPPFSLPFSSLESLDLILSWCNLAQFHPKQWNVWAEGKEDSLAKDPWKISVFKCYYRLTTTLSKQDVQF